MNIQTKDGPYGSKEIILSGYHGQREFTISVKVQENGKMTIVGAEKIEIDYSEFQINTEKYGMEDFPTVTLYSKSKELLGRRGGCLVVGEEKGGLVLKARDGLGDWTQQYFFKKV